MKALEQFGGEEVWLFCTLKIKNTIVTESPKLQLNLIKYFKRKKLNYSEAPRNTNIKCMNIMKSKIINLNFALNLEEI